MIRIRPGTKADEAYIATTWLHAVRTSDRQSRAIDSALLSRHVHFYASQVLSRPNVAVRVAGPDDDDVTICAFAVLEGPHLHFVYTRESWRKKGLAKQLLADVNLGETSFSWWTRAVSDWAWEKVQPLGMKYKPFWLGETK